MARNSHTMEHNAKQGADGNPEAHFFDGFDIPLTESDSLRIDRLVNDYESHIIQHLNDEYAKQTRRADRIADRIAAFGGSWAFIGLFGSFLAAWVFWNVLGLLPRFDPPPFILLNLILSFVAAFQAPIIMMSQNRQAIRDKHESIIDFAINYKAEREIEDIQGHLHRMERELADLRRLLLEGPAAGGEKTGDE